jgi:hypothetical protein
MQAPIFQLTTTSVKTYHKTLASKVHKNEQAPTALKNEEVFFSNMTSKICTKKNHLKPSLPLFFMLGHSNIKRFPSNHLSIHFIQLNKK